MNNSGSCVSLFGGNFIVSGLLLRDASEGIQAVVQGLHVDDVFFLSVWNRSYVGQVAPGQTNPCVNGWSPSVSIGQAVNVTIQNSHFVDIDVAFQPLGLVEKVLFLENTITGANGNTVFFTNSMDWLLSGCGETLEPRFFGVTFSAPLFITDVLIFHSIYQKQCTKILSMWDHRSVLSS